MKFKPQQPTKAQEQARIRELCSSFAEDAVEEIVSLMKNGKQEVTRLRAATTVLEYTIGKPIQHVQTPEQTERQITNDERREQMRLLVRQAFAKVVSENPELAPD